MSSFLSTEAVTSTQNNDVYFIFHMNLIWDPNSCVDNHSIKAKKKKWGQTPISQCWQHHTAVSERYGNDGGFTTNLDAAYIIAVWHFKDRLLSDRNKNL